MILFLRCNPFEIPRITFDISLRKFNIRVQFVMWYILRSVQRITLIRMTTYTERISIITNGD